MKEWKKPELQNLALGLTKEDAQPYYWHPRYKECSDPANTGSGYQMCKYHSRPCKYFGILGGGAIAECSAPTKTQGTIS